MAMLQTLVMSLLLFVQSFFIPFVNPPSKAPVDYGGTKHVNVAVARGNELPFYQNGKLLYGIIVGDYVSCGRPELNYTQSIQTGVRWLQEFVGELIGVENPFAVYTPDTAPPTIRIICGASSSRVYLCAASRRII